MTILPRRLPALIVLAALSASALTGCTSHLDRHGHVFTDEDIKQVRPGMSKEQVKVSLGTPDTTSTIGGGAYYYISSTQRHAPFMKPAVVDRKVVAVYFNESESVVRMANYGLRDGRIVDFMKGETPSRNSDLTMIEQFFGNLGNRAGNLGKDDDVDPF